MAARAGRPRRLIPAVDRPLCPLLSILSRGKFRSRTSAASAFAEVRRFSAGNQGRQPRGRGLVLPLHRDPERCRNESNRAETKAWQAKFGVVSCSLNRGSRRMIIHLPEELESSVRSLVKGGQFASVDEAIAEAARLLLRDQKQDHPSKAITLDELHREMLADGLLSQLPDAAKDTDDEDDGPVVIEGEPLSETIIRERR